MMKNIPKSTMGSQIGDMHMSPIIMSCERSSSSIFIVVLNFKDFRCHADAIRSPCERICRGPESETEAGMISIAHCAIDIAFCHYLCQVLMIQIVSPALLFLITSDQKEYRKKHIFDHVFSSNAVYQS